jgi:hypothetical protein
MTHDAECRWAKAKRRPFDDDQPGCDDCDLIAKGRASERQRIVTEIESMPCQMHNHRDATCHLAIDDVLVAVKDGAP